MSEAPSFNLAQGNLDIKNEEEFQEQAAKETGGKALQPGNYTLKIQNPDFHPNKETGSIYCKGDPTWFNVKVELVAADGERSLRHWVQVPTQKVRFGQKGTLFVFKKLKEFMAALGEDLTVDNLATVVPKYFNDPKALEGKEVDADVGYEGDYIEPAGNGQFRIVKGGEAYQEDGETVTFPDRDAARNYAEAIGIRNPATRTSVLEFKSKINADAKAEAANDEW